MEFKRVMINIIKIWFSIAVVIVAVFLLLLAVISLSRVGVQFGNFYLDIAVIFVVLVPICFTIGYFVSSATKDIVLLLWEEDSFLDKFFGEIQ